MMENKITERIDKIEIIIRYTFAALMMILGIIALKIKNDVLYTVAVTAGVYAIENMIVLQYIKTNISNIFFEEKLNNLKKEGK